jgi:hypothetical protein
MKEKATGLMQKKTSRELKHLVTGAASAKDAWKALEDTCKAQSVGSSKTTAQGSTEKEDRRRSDLYHVWKMIRTELKDAYNETVPDDAFIG